MNTTILLIISYMSKNLYYLYLFCLFIVFYSYFCGVLILLHFSFEKIM